MEEGDLYREVPKVISISICYFRIGQGEDYLYKGTTNFIGVNVGDILSLNANEKKIYAQRAEAISEIYSDYYLIKLDMFKDEVKNLTDEWIYFLKKEKIKGDFQSKGLQKASNRLDYLKLSQEKKREYDVYVENMRLEKSLAASRDIDYEIGLEKAEAKGLRRGLKRGIEEGVAKGIEKGIKYGMKQGIEQGERKKTLEIARILLSKKKSIDEVMGITLLTNAEVESLM